MDKDESNEERTNHRQRWGSRHLVLLQNDIDRWCRNVRSGSEKTAKVWLSAVGRVLEWATTPDLLLADRGRCHPTPGGLPR